MKCFLHLRVGLEVGFFLGAQQSTYRTPVVFQANDEAAATNTMQSHYTNCHSGKDFFSYEENDAFIDHTTQLTKEQCSHLS
jgi:hypothetical protein